MGPSSRVGLFLGPTLRPSEVSCPTRSPGVSSRSADVLTLFVVKEFFSLFRTWCRRRRRRPLFGVESLRPTIKTSETGTSDVVSDPQSLSTVVHRGLRDPPFAPTLFSNLSSPFLESKNYGDLNNRLDLVKTLTFI